MENGIVIIILTKEGIWNKLDDYYNYRSGEENKAEVTSLGLGKTQENPINNAENIDKLSIKFKFEEE